MDTMTSFLIISALLLMGVVVFSVGVFFLQSFLFPEPSPMRERLEQIKRQAAEEEGLLLDLDISGGNKLLKKTEFSNQKMGEMLQKYNFAHGLQKSLKQAGIKSPVDKFFMTFLVLPGIVGVVLGVVMANILLMLIGPGVFAVSVMMVKMKQGQRLEKLSRQLPDALNLITSSLRAGHSFQSALKTVVDELPDPVSTEFSQVVSDLNWGIPVRDALYKMVANLDTSADIRMFVTSLIIQRETGGNLAEILDKLSHTIRERFKLKGQVAALTGQARLTGYCLGCAPAGLFVFMYFFMHSYIEPLINNDIGKIAIGVGVVMQTVGFLIMRKIIEIRV